MDDQALLEIVKSLKSVIDSKDIWLRTDSRRQGYIYQLNYDATQGSDSALDKCVQVLVDLGIKNYYGSERIDTKPNAAFVIEPQNSLIHLNPAAMKKMKELEIDFPNMDFIEKFFSPSYGARGNIQTAIERGNIELNYSLHSSDHLNDREYLTGKAGTMPLLTMECSKEMEHLMIKDLNALGLHIVITDAGKKLPYEPAFFIQQHGDNVRFALGDAGVKQVLGKYINLVDHINMDEGFEAYNARFKRYSKGADFGETVASTFADDIERERRNPAIEKQIADHTSTPDKERDKAFYPFAKAVHSFIKDSPDGSERGR